MNKIVNKLLLGGDKFTPEMHLKQPGFTDSACGPFTKIKKIFRNLCRQKIQIIFTRMILISLLSTWYGLRKYKDLNKITQSDKLLKDRAFKLLAF